MKGKVKRILSGVLSVMTILSTIVQPAVTYAAKKEPAAYEAEYSALETVRDKLEGDEIVTAKDYEVETGSSFDVKTDLSGIEFNPEKVKVIFHEAKGSDGNEFDIKRPGSYQAVYFVEPLSGNPFYHIRRKLTVKESVKEIEKKGDYHVTVTKGTELGVTLDHEDGSYNPGDTVLFSMNFPEGGLPAVGALKETANAEENTADLLYSEVTYHADTDMYSFEMPADNISLEVSQDHAEGGIMPLASSGDSLWDEETDIEANTYYYYSDGQMHPFNSVMGSGGNDSYKYVRYKVDGKTYTVNAYCMQHSMASPPSGTTYTKMVELDEGGDDKYLRKALFYGYGGPGWGDTFNGYNIKTIMTKAGCTSEIRAMQHYLVDYLYDGEAGFGGFLSSTAINMLKEIKTALKNMPDPTAVELRPGLSVKASGTDTETFTWKANEAFTLTIQLEDGVSLVNETTGKTSTGKVTVKGGDKFHLTVTTDNVSKLKGDYPITSNYPLDFHAMLLKLQNSQDISFGYYTDSPDLSLKVDWPEIAKVKVIKVDSQKTDVKLSGAVFGLYKDKDCTQLITKMPATDSNGASTVEITKTQNTVYLKEITAPKGYRINTSAYNVNLVANQTTSVTVPDVEQLGEITIYKEGQVLTGANVNDTGVSFNYTKRRQPGAVYNVYAGADITTAYGAEVYKKGALVKQNLTTGTNGSVTLGKLHLGTYIVKEVQAPKNFYNAGEEKTVTLSYAGQTAEVSFSETTFENDRQKVSVAVVKKDKDTLNPLDGGIFGLYAGSDITDADGKVVVKKGTLIEKATTGEDGKAVFKADLPIGFSYDVKEVQAPEGYLRNTSEVYTFQFSYTNDKEPVLAFGHTFTNERVNAKISLQKKDKETNKAVAQGDATLEKAVYGLYARTDIVHPDGATGVLYKAGDKVATLTTDAKGTAFVENLYLGNYYVKEITPPVGYLADETEYDLVCNYEGDLVATVERSCVSPEQVKKQPFQIIKAADNGKTDADLLSGSGFTAYLVSSLKTNEDGSYDFSSAVPVVIGENGATEIFTDEKGYACSIPLPYGTYIVRETTTPHNYTPVNDFIVRITEHKPNTPQVWRVLLDDEFEAKLKIIKQDDETKKPVLAKNTEFQIYDLDDQKYVEQVTTYPTTVVHKSFFTDEQGYLILPQNLKIGNYRIEEVKAPFGYTVNEDYYEVAVDSNTPYQMDSVSGDVVIEVIYENHPVKGDLRIVKQGEVLDGFRKDFSYVKENLADAVFEVYAAEDIYTADFQKDSEGKRILEYKSGELVSMLTTNENGEAVLKSLPLGTYRIVEVKAPGGFVLNASEQTVTFAYVDQDTPVVKETVTFENDRQKVEIAVVKKDADTGSVIEGAIFGLYAKTDITAHGKVIVEADTMLGEAVTGEDGKALFALDVPFGEYYIKEEKAPAGYVSSAEVIDVTAAYQGQEIKVVSLTPEYQNEPTRISVKKTDITTGVELSGATLTVLDKDGNVVDTWNSVKGEEHIIERLHVGETYTLREEMAPYGYLAAEEITFTVEDTAEVQKVEMHDDVPTGLLIINKKGEFLDNVSVLDSIGGWMSHLFEYLSGSLKDVTFEVHALEDVKAADGESEDYYKKDELVADIATDDIGCAILDNLPLGKYYVKEKETAEGYVLDGEIREIDLTYRDQDTAVVTYSTDWQNNRQKAEVSVLKKEKNTDRVLAGAVFALCVKEDIVNAAGDVIMEADTVIEERTTDSEGKLTFEADLPIGFAYYVKETCPAPGFVTTDEVQEFVFSYEGADKESVSFEFVFENESTFFEFTKTSLTDGKEVEGATLQVLDENGEVVDEWVSGKEPHIITELVAGKTYTMRETIPADGYVTAEDIAFTVEDTVEVQKVEMKDDVTKVEITKSDLTNGKELPGAKLKVTDEDGNTVDEWVSTKNPHRIERLVVGKTYILTETLPADGYVTAESIEFKVKDTSKEQKVEMKDDVTKVEISKQDIAGEELPGAKLTILDKDGKTVESWTSGKEPHYIEMLPIGEYTLREETAPDGYLVANDVKFTVEDTGKVQHVAMVDEPKPQPQPQSSAGSGTPSMRVKDTPKTGDDSHMLLWLILAGAALCVVTGSLVLTRMKKED